MLTRQTIEKVIKRAYAEDSPHGDLTSETLIPENAYIEATLQARESGTLSGGALIVEAMRASDRRIVTTLHYTDGTTFNKGATLATVNGPARGILRAERIALNIAQRMSGIATLTAEYVAHVTGTNTRIVDTRKTTPGLRQLERQAVRDGGGHNHRYSLSDAVLVKDNHLAIIAQLHGGDLISVLRGMRSKLSHMTRIEVEVDQLKQIPLILELGIDAIMLDNFSLTQLREAVTLINGRALVEASGGITLDTVAAIADTGVDIISVGALTHSARALDFGLDIDPGARIPTNPPPLLNLTRSTSRS